MGMEDGRARIVSLTANIFDSRRHHRADGGAIIDMETDRVLAGAVMTISSPKTGRLEELALGDNIAPRGTTLWCGFLIVDLRH